MVNRRTFLAALGAIPVLPAILAASNAPEPVLAPALPIPAPPVQAPLRLIKGFRSVMLETSHWYPHDPWRSYERVGVHVDYADGSTELVFHSDLEGAARVEKDWQYTVEEARKAVSKGDIRRFKAAGVNRGIYTA